MPYLGNKPVNNFVSFAKQNITGNGGTSYSLDHPVTGANDIELFINNVRQEPTEAYSASGATLTLTGAISSTDDVYVIFRGRALQTVGHPSDQALEATSAVIGGNSVLTTASNIAQNTGNVWHIYSSGNTTLVDATYTKIALNSTRYNIGGGSLDTSNYRFTPSVAGYYSVSASIDLTPDGSQTGNFIVNIRKNGTTMAYVDAYRGQTGRHSACITTVIYMNGSSDYVELFCYRESSLAQDAFASASATYLTGYLVRV